MRNYRRKRRAILRVRNLWYRSHSSSRCFFTTDSQRENGDTSSEIFSIAGDNGLLLGDILKLGSFDFIDPRVVTYFQGITVSQRGRFTANVKLLGHDYEDFYDIRRKVVKEGRGATLIEMVYLAHLYPGLQLKVPILGTGTTRKSRSGHEYIPLLYRGCDDKRGLGLFDISPGTKADTPFNKELWHTLIHFAVVS